VEAPAAAVLAVAETLRTGEGTRGAPRAEEAHSAQDLAGGIGEPGQVVEALLADEVLAVGIPHGKRQPDPEVDRSPPRGAEATLVGVGDDCGPGLGVAGKLAVPDASCVVKRHPAMPVQQSNLPAHARRTHPLVIDRLGFCGSEALQP